MSIDDNKKFCDFEIHTVRKDIKNIHLGVYPPNGRVRIAAPTKTTDETLKILVTSKMPWINKQKAKFKKQQRQTKREFVSGESHHFLGNRYLLNVVDTDSAPRVEIKRKIQMDLYVRPGTSTEKREKIMDNFYRSELKKRIPILNRKWEKITKKRVKEFRIKKMKTKWGTCNPQHQRVWFNLELAKKPLHCLEYVLVHEMTHFVERNHTKEFKLLLKSSMPNWSHNRDELNDGTLAYSKWEHDGRAVRGSTK